jgi:hypothetical protein
LTVSPVPTSVPEGQVCDPRGNAADRRYTASRN